MAEADLDAVIRQIAKAQNKSLMAAVKKRRDQIMARAAKAKDKDARDQLKHLAKSAMLHGAAAAKRLQNSAENTAGPGLIRFSRSAKDSSDAETTLPPTAREARSGNVAKSVVMPLPC